MDRFYRIGTPGEPWGAAEKQLWFESQPVQRSYRDEVLAKLQVLNDTFEVFQYGSLPIDRQRYPLMAVKVGSDRTGAPWALITGGVHGYETSGVHGALEFLMSHASSYRDRLNLVVAPCISPWGYEVINRWNPNCLDPNRSFTSGTAAEESAGLMGLLADLGVEFRVHMDLHETTDSDESEFRPAVAARDGEPFEPGAIPDGFYIVGDTENPQPEFQAAVIAGVGQVTHIAPSDDHGQIIGSDVTQPGVINYRNTEWGLCTGVTGARFTTTTEVYPDSPKATPAVCIDAQVAAVRAGLDFVLATA
jgi:hypothetical protein